MTKPKTTAKNELPVVTSEAIDTSIPTNPDLYQQAIKHGLAVLSKDSSKASAAREIYAMLHGEHRDVILRAFIEGATVTVKGAPTYLYNISRKFARKAKTDAATGTVIAADTVTAE
jgi:hypothetical protein